MSLHPKRLQFRLKQSERQQQCFTGQLPLPWGRNIAKIGPIKACALVAWLVIFNMRDFLRPRTGALRVVKVTTRSKIALVLVEEKIPSGKKPWMRTENAKKPACLPCLSRRLKTKARAKARTVGKAEAKVAKVKAKAKVARARIRPR